MRPDSFLSLLPSLLALCNKKKAKSSQFTINLHKKFSFSKKIYFKKKSHVLQKENESNYNSSLWLFSSSKENGREKINELEESTFLREDAKQQRITGSQGLQTLSFKRNLKCNKHDDDFKVNENERKVSHLSNFHCSRIDFHSLPWLREKFPFHQLACCFFRTSFRNGILNATYCELFFTRGKNFSAGIWKVRMNV